jgi:hypothetical protein
MCTVRRGTHFPGQHQQPVASALTQVLGHIQVPILGGYEEARGAILRTPRMYVTCDVNYTKPLLDIIAHTHACMSPHAPALSHIYLAGQPYIPRNGSLL